MSIMRRLSMCLWVISTATLAGPGLDAQVRIGGPATRVHHAFVPFGNVATTTAAQATAIERVTIDPVAGYPSSLPRRTIRFATSACRDEPPVPGQPVRLRTDGRMVRFVCFPLLIADTGETVVGRGAGKGRFIMRTRGLRLSNDGSVSGRTEVKSGDFISGFTGSLWLRVADADGQEIALTKAGCWGVNLRSGREAAWRVQIEERALAAAGVEVWHLHDSCGIDRTGAFLDDVERAAEVAGTIAEAYVTASAGGRR